MGSKGDKLRGQRLDELGCASPSPPHGKHQPYKPGRVPHGVRMSLQPWRIGTELAGGRVSPPALLSLFCLGLAFVDLFPRWSSALSSIYLDTFPLHFVVAEKNTVFICQVDKRLKRLIQPNITGMTLICNIPVQEMLHYSFV